MRCVTCVHPLCLMFLLRMRGSGMYSTDTGVYYAHTRDAGGDLRPLRRHEQLVSLKKIWFAMVMIPLLRSPSEHRFVHKMSCPIRVSGRYAVCANFLVHESTPVL